MVNNVTLNWDIPECPQTTEELLNLSKAWYGQIVESLEQNVVDSRTIAYISLTGHPGYQWAMVMDIFGDDSIYLAEAQTYVAAMVSYLRETTIPIGIYVTPSGWQPDRDLNFDSLDNLLAAVGMNQLDYLEISSSPSVATNVDEIIKRVGSCPDDQPGCASAWLNSRKIVLCDFHTWHYRDTPHSQEDIFRDHLLLVSEGQLGGWWYWQYRDGVRNTGLRANGHFDRIDEGWKNALIDEIWNNQE